MTAIRHSSNGIQATFPRVRASSSNNSIFSTTMTRLVQIVFAIFCAPAMMLASDAERDWLSSFGADLKDSDGRITEIRISDRRISREVIDHVARLKSGQRLWFTSCAFDDDAVGRLSVLNDTALIDFGLYESQINTEMIAAISQLTTLKALGLGGSRGLSSGLEPLAGLNGLTTLRLPSSDISDAALASVGKIRSLSMLMLDKTSITSDGLRHLASLPVLNYLSLDDTTTDDEACQVLARLSVGALMLDRTRVTDRGLAYLATNRHLKIITLNNTATSDSGVKHFEDEGVFPELSEIGIVGTHISLGASRRMEWLSRLEFVKKQILSENAELRRARQPLSTGSKLHVLLAMDTNAHNIGPAIKVDSNILTKVFGEIAQARPGKLDIAVLDDLDCTPDHVRAYYTFKCGNDESLLFFYNGHGGLDEVRGQFLAMSNGDQLYRSELREMMESTGARLCTIITDCCSNIAGFTPPNRRVPADWDMFKQLFFSQAGIVDMTGTSEGELCWYNYAEGGMFTRAISQLLCEPIARVDINGMGSLLGRSFLSWQGTRLITTFNRHDRAPPKAMRSNRLPLNTHLATI
jgi:hypothetical protein